jgi:hypothetical protein
VPTKLEDHEFLMRCSCGDRIEHVAWLVHDQEEGQPRFDSWYLMLAMDPGFSFWRRLKTAVSYLLRPHNHRWAGYAELVLRNEDIAELEEFIFRRRNKS